MALPPGCLDDPEALFENRFCVHNLSKDAHGNLELINSEPQKCAKPGCLTLKTLHRFKVELRRHDCDSPDGALLDGTLVVERLVTAFERDGLHRGVHAGDFQWFVDAGGLISGRISGITNAGTHREPIFKPCERCDQRGVLIGRLCGEIEQAPPGADYLQRAKIVATYKVSFDPSEDGGQGGVRGTLEGVVVVPCLA